MGRRLVLECRLDVPLLHGDGEEERKESETGWYACIDFHVSRICLGLSIAEAEKSGRKKLWRDSAYRMVMSVRQDWF